MMLVNSDARNLPLASESVQELNLNGFWERKTSRFRRVVKDGVSDGMISIVLPNCPVHAGMFEQIARGFCGERAVHLYVRTLHTYSHLVEEQVCGCFPKDARNVHSVSRNGWLPRQYSHSAIDHNNENHRMARALCSIVTCIPCAEKSCRIDDRLELLALFVQHLYIYENSILSDDCNESLLLKTPHLIVRKPLYELAYVPPECMFYEHYTMSLSHYATFPPKLVEPCILAGSRPGDIVFDPFAGTSTVGVVCLWHGRRYVGGELGWHNIELSRERLRSQMGMGI